MAKLKEVHSTEVHWQIAEWAVKDQANLRIRQLMGDNARFFCPVYVTHAGYYWSEPDAAGWTMLTDATDDDRTAVLSKIESMRADALRRFPTQQTRIDYVFSRPNDDFVFFRRDASGNIDLRLTGWGFANFKRATGAPISDAPAADTIHEISVSFSIDGHRVPARDFELFRGTAWAAEKTDAQGFYSLGKLPSGRRVQLRDTATGIERIAEITDETDNIDVDVTEFLTVRLTARHDNAPVSGETAELVYGHRTAELRLVNGVAECRLPWLEGTDCRVSLRGQTQTRQLDKTTVNLFEFEFVTPAIPRVAVSVSVSGDGAPIANEFIRIDYSGSIRELVTDVSGKARTEFEVPVGTPARPCSAYCRDASATEQLEAADLEFFFTFDTPVIEEFDASILVIDADGNTVGGYPVAVRIGESEGGYLSDGNGLVQLSRLPGGATMRVTDGTNPAFFRDYLLNPRQPQYVFQLPFETTPSDSDMTLRVIELGNRPSAGTTCVLKQADSRLLAHLDERGEMHFGSADFGIGTPIEVGLFSDRRTFPPLQLSLVEGEKEYELREVEGPTPWWKILLEILAALGAATVIFFLAFFLYALFKTLPLIFA